MEKFFIFQMDNILTFLISLILVFTPAYCQHSFVFDPPEPSTPRLTAEDFYANCSTERIIKSNKACYGVFKGDCLIKKSCVLAAAVTDKGTHFDMVLMKTNLFSPQGSMEGRGPYLALTLATVDKSMRRHTIECRPPRLADFKVFFFWTRGNEVDSIPSGRGFFYSAKSLDKAEWMKDCESRLRTMKSRNFDYADENLSERILLEHHLVFSFGDTNRNNILREYDMAHEKKPSEYGNEQGSHSIVAEAGRSSGQNVFPFHFFITLCITLLCLRKIL